MKIGIESQRIFRRSKHGMDVVALELIRQIQQLDKKNQYYLFAKNGDDRHCVTDTKNFTTKIVNGITYADWEQVSLPRAVKNNRVDVLHCTANTAPFNSPVPTIVTVHDVIYLEETSFKGSAYQNFGNLYRKFVVPKAIENAKKVVTVSAYEKDVICKACKVDPAKIEVIHNGVSERFHSNFTDVELSDFRKQYQLPLQFILFLGNTAPKKNTVGALQAYAEYCTNASAPLKLVVTDFPSSSIKSILQSNKRPEVMQNIIAPGYIPSTQMPLLYNCCNVFLYPSLRESFGLPVLEAMACGKPVIASNIAPLREVAGDAATFVDPADTKQMGETLYSLLNDIQQQAALIQ